RDAGILDREPDKLQQQPLLGVHLCCLAGGDAEKRRLEQIDPRDQPGSPGVALAALASIRMEVKSGRPSLRVNFGDCISPRDEQPPELLQVPGPRESAGSSDDRNRS